MVGGDAFVGRKRRIVIHEMFHSSYLKIFFKDANKAVGCDFSWHARNERSFQTFLGIVPVKERTGGHQGVGGQDSSF